ncbi:PAAR-like protein [Clostridium estertheticum]|uniref:PAAR-like protein n=1 Tax=Clostridium estertheticum TaxID=238834 RepID=UPI001CF4FC6D|nr:PAAR-like protein [Clostridium estertheticum]MCB2342181.1 DUF4280 domain-containing protein [Clostridium estertheticum]
MRCDKGKNARKINLPEGYVAYATEKSMMNKSDNVVNKNISYFGICSECKEGEDGKQLPAVKNK